MRAILQRDEARFQKALAHCDPNHKSASTGLSPIHFSVIWPRALAALIQIGVDVNVEDHSHRRPIHLAAALGDDEAAKILIAQDCAVWTHIDSFSLLQEALLGNNKENRRCIANSVITAYIDRHTRFFDLARSVLPQSSPIFLELVPGELQENLVPQIQQEFKRHHFHIPSALELDTDGSSVYEVARLHADIRLTVRMADRLWDGGFRQIHAYFGRGITPLLESWYNADFEMITWLISKGASPFSRHEQTQGSGLHLYAHRLGYPRSSFQPGISAVYCDEAIVWQLESDPDSRRDSCCCLCSLGGCMPVVVFLKSNHNLRYGIRGSTYRDYLNELCLFWKKLPPAPGEENSSMGAVLRFLVFEKMDLKHQCCRLGHRAEDCRVGEPLLEKNPPESEYEMEAKFREYREKMQMCECRPLEKPLCAVFLDHCKSL